MAHTGAMIALVPTDADAQRIAVDGGEEPEELHVTLLYLGDAVMIPAEVRESIIAVIEGWARDLASTVIGDAFAVNMFNPPSGDDVTAGGREPCVVLGISGDQLDNLHEVILNSVNGAMSSAGISMHPQHRPWVAHMTLVYTDDADLSYFTDRVGPVTFDRIRVAFGDDVVDIPLGKCSCSSTSDSEAVVAKFDPSQPRDTEGKWSAVPGSSLLRKLIGDKESAGTSTVTSSPNGTTKYPSVVFREIRAMQDSMYSPRNWSNVERSAVRSYTGLGYAKMNSMLRSGTVKKALNGSDEDARDAAANIQVLTNMMRPSKQNVMLFRSVDLSTLNVHKATDLHKLTGKKITTAGFTSTKISRDGGFGSTCDDCVTLNIMTPSGTRMTFVQPESTYSNENEVLLPPGVKYRVLGVEPPTDSNSHWQVMMEVISSE